MIKHQALHSEHYSSLLVRKNVITHYQVVIAVGFHLFPFRTEKLSPLAPMVLQCNAGEQDAAFFQIHESLRVITTLRLFTV